MSQIKITKLVNIYNHPFTIIEKLKSLSLFGILLLLLGGLCGYLIVKQQRPKYLPFSPQISEVIPITTVTQISNPNLTPTPEISGVVLVPTEIIIPIPVLPISDEEIKDWITYSDTDANFIIRYPSFINFIKFELPKESNSLNLELPTKEITLSIRKKKLEPPYDFDDTMGYSSENAVKDREKLNRGDYGERIDWDYARSVLKIDDHYAKSFLVLGRFEACDVTFERKAIFYNKDYQIVITLYGVNEDIINAMPEYFQIDPTNCGKEIMVRNFDRIDEFYDTLAKGEGLGAAQEWFNTFDKIVRTIKIE